MKLRNDRGWQRAGEDLALQVLQNQLHTNNIFCVEGGGEDRGKMELLVLDKET